MKKSIKSVALISVIAFSGLNLIVPTVARHLLILPPLWILFPSELVGACPVLSCSILAILAGFLFRINPISRQLDLSALISTCVHVMFLFDLESTPQIPVGHGSTLRCKKGVPSSMCFPHLGIGSIHTMALVLISLLLKRSIGQVCLALDGASLLIYGLLASSGVSVPPDPSFVVVRLVVVGFQLLVDIATVASAGSEILFDHLGGLGIGVGYVLVFTPTLGDFPIAPYLLPCTSDSGCLPFGISVGFGRWMAVLITVIILLRRRLIRKRAEIDFMSGYKALRSVLYSPDTTDIDDDSPMSVQDVL